MLIEAPFYYKAVVRRQGKRKHEDTGFLGRVPVTIREPDPSEAPVALRIPDPHGAFDAPKTVDIRWYDGRLYAPYEPSDGSRQPRLPRDAAWLLEVNAEPQSYNNPLKAGCERWQASGTRIEADPTVAVVVSSDQDRIAAEIREKARDVLLIDGWMWHAVTEPCLVHSVSNDWKHAWTWVRYGDANASPHDVFRLDELDRLVEMHARRHGRLALEDPGIEVLIPESLSLDTATPALRAVAARWLSRLKDNIAERDAAYFAAFAALRGAVAASEEAGTLAPEAADALAEAVRGAVEADTGRLAGSAPDRGDWLAQRTEEALDRYGHGRHAREDLAGLAP